MKEYKIGEIFEVNGQKMVCLPRPQEIAGAGCSQCVFDYTPSSCKDVNCTLKWREDKKAVIFRPLNDMGENYHYSKKLGRVVAFQPTGDQPVGMVCKKCVLGHFKTATWTDCC